MGDFSNFIPALINTGAFGLVAFVMHRLIEKSLPELSRLFAASTQKQAEAGERVLQEFLKELRITREAFQVELQRERDTISGHTDKITQALEDQNKLLLYLLATLQGSPITRQQRDMLGLPPSEPPSVKQ